MNPSCDGCKKATDPKQSIDLEGGWSIGHYRGSEGFFGWLALQTKQHRMKMEDLCDDELKSLGVNLKKLEHGIYKYWESRGHPVERVYFMYLLEGLLEEDNVWHLHIHLVPRFKDIKCGMENKPGLHGDVIKGINAYAIASLKYLSDYPLPPFLDRQRWFRDELATREYEIVNGVHRHGFLS